METKNAIKKLNGLLEGEISAVQTYEQATEKEKHSSDVQRLRSIQSDHEDAVAKLHFQVTKLGGEPAKDSSAWGAWARTVEGAATLFGDKTALKALKEGEEHGIKEYREALEEEDVPSETKTLIRNTLLPRQQEHIQYLNGLLEAH